MSTDEHEVTFQSDGWKLNDEVDAQKVIDKIKAVSKVKTLTLSTLSIGSPAAAVIGRCIADLPDLEVANWSDIIVSRLLDDVPKTFTFLLRGVQDSSCHLSHLDMSNNAIGPVGLTGLTEFFKSQACLHLKSLNFNNTGMGPAGSCTLAELLLPNVELGLRLETFIMGRSRVEDKGVKGLSPVFAKMGSLKHLSIPQDGITAAGFRVLAKCLVANPDLETLNIDDNTAKSDGCKVIASAFPKLKKLRVLKIADCLTETDGLVELLDVLDDHCPMLQELDISNNEIEPNLIPRLIDCLSNKAHFRLLEANGNLFGSDGVSLLKRQMSALNLKVGSLSECCDSDSDSSTSDSESESNPTNESDQQQPCSLGNPMAALRISNGNDARTQADGDAVPSEALSLLAVAIECFSDEPGADTFESLYERSIDQPETFARAVEKVCSEAPFDLYFRLLSLSTTVSTTNYTTALADATLRHLLAPYEEVAVAGVLTTAILSSLGNSAASITARRAGVELALPPSAAYVDLVCHMVAQSYCPRRTTDILRFCLDTADAQCSLEAKDVQKLIAACSARS